MGFGLVAHDGESADLEQIYTLLLPCDYTLDESNGISEHDQSLSVRLMDEDSPPM